MTAATRHATALLVAMAVAAVFSAAQAQSQSCPAPLDHSRRLVLVTAKAMNDATAEMRLYERASASEPWRAASEPEPAMLGRAGMGWSHFFRRYAHAGEPLKVEGDRRAPAGIYPIGRSFGILPSSRPDYLRVTQDTVCVNEPSSPHYNAITSRKLIAPNTSVENMSRALPMYRRGLVVGYPTDGKARAGSCIFIHVWRSPTSGTAGCVSLPEPRVEALQDFAATGAVVAILPQAALGRFGNCLPASGETAAR
jgi:L,D-peptidoglycan transpeptidase YkuD (ErfK/YbiS/YcfS/YnhG family)